MGEPAERAEGSLSFLLQAAEVLASSLDYEKTLDHVARLVVPCLADWYWVFLIHEADDIRLASLHHQDPRTVKRAHEIFQRYRPDLKANEGMGRVLRTGKPELYPDMDDAFLRSIARGEEHMR